jgi:hypothetical protein
MAEFQIEAGEKGCCASAATRRAQSWRAWSYSSAA